MTKKRSIAEKSIYRTLTVYQIDILERAMADAVSNMVKKESREVTQAVTVLELLRRAQGVSIRILESDS